MHPSRACCHSPTQKEQGHGKHHQERLLKQGSHHGILPLERAIDNGFKEQSQSHFLAPSDWMWGQEERQGKGARSRREGLSELLPGRTEPFVSTSSGTAFKTTARSIQISFIGQPTKRKCPSGEEGEGKARASTHEVCKYCPLQVKLTRDLKTNKPIFRGD